MFAAYAAFAYTLKGVGWLIWREKSPFAKKPKP